MLVARAHRDGRAQRSARLRHRAIAANPLCIAAWQLGAEPYTVGALAFGTQKGGFQSYVPGFPLNRDLLFAEMTRFAKDFYPAFEKAGGKAGQYIEHFGDQLWVPERLPQFIMANRETVEMLGRLGRRLAYLPTEGEQPVDPILPRLGRILMWIAEHAKIPGQQLVLVATELLNAHWQTPMSTFESASLAALDAWIQPPNGKSGFEAAQYVERVPYGPRPNQRIGEDVQKLMKTFNTARASSTDPKLVEPLRKSLRVYYNSLLQRTWELVWRVVDRERAVPEAPSVARREREDRIAYAAQLAWLNGPAQGRRRTRQTPRNAALSLSRLEAAQNRLIAEEAIDDPARMAGVVLAGKAVAGEVVMCDEFHREVVNHRNVKRPRVTIESLEPCVMPAGKQLWWTKAADKREWVIESATPTPAGGARVTLVLQTNRSQGLPGVGTRACFSEFNLGIAYELHLPAKAPWTHRSPSESQPDSHLENSAGQEVA